jgi:signal transduction histidine kinase
MNARVVTGIGLATWAAAGIPLLTHAQHRPERPVLWVIGYATFGVLFLVGMRSLSRVTTLALLGVQSIIALSLTWLAPTGSTGILLVLVAAEMGADLPFRAALLGIAAQTVVLALIITATERVESPSSVVVAYLMFQVFGAVTSHAAIAERMARQELSQANTELRVATELLDVQTRSAERLRIARDLHDIIGHHLTALSLNLEMVDFRATPEMKEDVEKCRALTRSLLADVRDVVRRLRDDEPVDLARAVLSMRNAISTPQVHVTTPEDLHAGAVIGNVALRCVQEIATNAVRHSGARNLHLTLARRNGILTVDARDDGHGVEVVRFGNGLRGMRERVEAAHGSVHFQSEYGRGFAVHIELPVSHRENA